MTVFPENVTFFDSLYVGQHKSINESIIWNKSTLYYYRFREFHRNNPILI